MLLFSFFLNQGIQSESTDWYYLLKKSIYPQIISRIYKIIFSKKKCGSEPGLNYFKRVNNTPLPTILLYEKTYDKLYFISAH